MLFVFSAFILHIYNYFLKRELESNDDSNEGPNNVGDEFSEENTCDDPMMYRRLIQQYGRQEIYTCCMNQKE